MNKFKVPPPETKQTDLCSTSRSESLPALFVTCFGDSEVWV